LCSDVREVVILQRLRCADADYHGQSPVNCRVNMGATFRWTRTPEFKKTNTWGSKQHPL